MFNSYQNKVKSSIVMLERTTELYCLQLFGELAYKWNLFAYNWKMFTHNWSCLLTNEVVLLTNRDTGPGITGRPEIITI